MMSRETHGYERVLNNVSACRMPFWARPTTPRLRRNTWQVSSLAIPFRENQKRNCVCAQTRQVENHQFMMMRASSSLSSSFTCLCVLYLYILHFHITACMVCVPFGLFRGVGIFSFFPPSRRCFRFVSVCVLRAGVWWTGPKCARDCGIRNFLIYSAAAIVVLVYVFIWGAFPALPLPLIVFYDFLLLLFLLLRLIQLLCLRSRFKTLFLFIYLCLFISCFSLEVLLIFGGGFKEKYSKHFPLLLSLFPLSLSLSLPSLDYCR